MRLSFKQALLSTTALRGIMVNAGNVENLNRAVDRAVQMTNMRMSGRLMWAKGEDTFPRKASIPGSVRRAMSRMHSTPESCPECGEPEHAGPCQNSVERAWLELSPEEQDRAIKMALDAGGS